MNEKEMLRVFKDWISELELMARYNDRAVDYERFSAVESVIELLEKRKTDGKE